MIILIIFSLYCIWNTNIVNYNVESQLKGGGGSPTPIINAEFKKIDPFSEIVTMTVLLTNGIPGTAAEDGG